MRRQRARLIPNSLVGRHIITIPTSLRHFSLRLLLQQGGKFIWYKTCRFHLITIVDSLTPMVIWVLWADSTYFKNKVLVDHRI